MRVSSMLGLIAEILMGVAFLLVVLGIYLKRRK